MTSNDLDHGIDSVEVPTEAPVAPAAIATNGLGHRGDFAEGGTDTHVKPGTLRGDFAAGNEETPRTGTIQPVGDFATGEEATPTDPTALRGDFARGHEDTPRK